MELDVVEVCRVLERRDVPVQIPHPLVNSRVAGPDVADVALEVLDIHRLFPVSSLPLLSGVGALE